MSSSWGEGLVLDVTEADASWLHETDLGAPSGDWVAQGWGESADELDEASVGQWLANIGSGAATGAATGLAAGPWGALVGGLLGGGLGAVQTALAPQPPAGSPAPPPRPAAPQPVAAPRPAPPPGPARPPAARPTPRPVTPQPAVPQPAVPQPAAPRPVAGATDLGTAQLLDQLAALVPVVAALAVQVGQLSQAGQAPGGAESAADGENAGAEQDLDGCRCGGSGRNDAEGDRAGESGHAGLTADLWAPGSSGEWAGPTAHDDDPVWR